MLSSYYRVTPKYVRRVLLGTSVKEVLSGTQGHPDLCFGGFITNGEPNRLLPLIQPSGAIEETGPIFITF